VRLSSIATVPYLQRKAPAGAEHGVIVASPIIK